MAVQYELTRKFAVSPDALFTICQQALKMCDFAVEQVDSVQNSIQAKANFTVFSLGERLDVMVGEDGGVWVRSSSVQSTARFDYGKNERNVGKFFEALDAVLSVGVPPARATTVAVDDGDVTVLPAAVEPVPKKLPRRAKAADSLPSRGKLRRAILDYFSESELEDLCFDMNIDHERFPAKGKAELVRELIAYCERNRRTAELVQHCQELRPGIEW